ncbi:MAG: cysteine-S-conjugate beta-lyase [Actinomycetota bacterium]|nr:cysteine-S-conjugate beta-lyase [Actinomycetota bacterium]
MSDGSEPDFSLPEASLRAAGSIKWTMQGPQVLPAWVAEMDVRGCPAVVEALHRAVDDGAFGYPARDRDTDLPAATVELLERLSGWVVPAEQVVSCGDVLSGIRIVLDALCEGAPVVLPLPAYPPFLEAIPLTGRKIVGVPCVSESGSRQRLDLDRIDDALAAGARTVLLTQPHNPLGRVFTRDELLGLRDVVDRRGARVISDEIHSPLVLPGHRHVPYASLPGAGAHTTTLIAASKAWNVPGLRCAQIVCSTPEDLAALRKLPHVANHGVSSLGVVATIAAYRHGETWRQGVLRHLVDQRDLFGRLLAGQLPDASWEPLEATYLAWVDARAYRGRTADGQDRDCFDPGAAALKRGKVMVNRGADFGPGYEGFVRVNLGTSAERLHEIVRRLALAWT